MSTKVALKAIYVPSEEVVAREIEGELIIIPLTAGIGDMEDELYTLNETGKAIWDRLDGVRNLQDIAEELVAEFEGTRGEIEQDVVGLIGELYQRKMVVAKE
ncbi:MAG: PqqD family protein [Deltaproteobacteria bacterium]|nr:PqqD family protein [Deltaproteobacteria bacterium]